MRTFLRTAIFATGLLGLLVAVPAQAATIQMSAFFANASNDCSGLFGKADGSPICDVGTALTTGDTTVSPWIAKLNANGTLDGTNGAFTTITGAEFSLVGGNWTYTPGAGDPALKYWVSKNANDFTLFWLVNDVGGATPGACTAGSSSPATTSAAYNFNCLQLAVAVTSGSVLTQGLSHVTFYDTGGTIDEQCVGCTVATPEPASLMLLGTGLAGLAIAVRRRRRNS